jgi:hypothetical protein
MGGAVHGRPFNRLQPQKPYLQKAQRLAVLATGKDKGWDELLLFVAKPRRLIIVGDGFLVQQQIVDLAD